MDMDASVGIDVGVDTGRPVVMEGTWGSEMPSAKPVWVGLR